jgi:hypothetical protein
MTPRKVTAAVATYGDHEVITPENKLRKAIATRPASSDDDDPVARAEKALAELSGEFSSWMDSECERLDKARRMVERVLAHCAAEPSIERASLLALLRRFAVEAARDEARLFCEDLVIDAPAIPSVVPATRLLDARAAA